MVQFAVPKLTRRPFLGMASAALAAAPLAVAPAARAGEPSPRPAGSLEKRNAAVIRRALAQFYRHGRTDRFEEFFVGDYVEHDPAVAAGRSGLVAWVDQQRAVRPRVISTVKHLIAQGTMVAVHSHRSDTSADEATGTAVVDLFDLRAGRIVEHWSYTQAVPAATRSGNSMFSDLYPYPDGPPPVSRARAEANKQLLLKAWAAVFTARDFTVLDRYWATGDGYLQHNPYVPNGVAGLEGYLGTLPPSVSQNRFAVAAGDLVLTVNQSVATSANLDSDRVGSAVVDLYRWVEGRAVEHWDVIGAVPSASLNGTSVFSRLYPPAG